MIDAFLTPRVSSVISGQLHLPAVAQRGVLVALFVASLPLENSGRGARRPSPLHGDADRATLVAC